MLQYACPCVLQNLSLTEYLENDWARLLEDYLLNLETPNVKSLGELLKFHEEHADLEFPPRKF